MLSVHSVVALESTVSKRKHFEPVYNFCDLFSDIKYLDQYFQLQATPLNWCKLFQIGWGDGESSQHPPENLLFKVGQAIGFMCCDAGRIVSSRNISQFKVLVQPGLLSLVSRWSRANDGFGEQERDKINCNYILYDNILLFLMCEVATRYH